MNIGFEELDQEEKEVLGEALAGDVRSGPSKEYAAELRRRLLSVAMPSRVFRAKPSRRALLGSILAGGIAATVLAVLWFLNAQPAWAAAIKLAREQAWIHAEIQQDGVNKGEVWVSPERDIVGAKFGATVVFLDYQRQEFLRYDPDQKAVFRTVQPQNMDLTHELARVSSLAAAFRRSPGAPSLFPGEPIERWSLRSNVVDGIACDEYQIAIRQPDRPLKTVVLTIDRRRSLPHSLTMSDGESHSVKFLFDYPSAGPLDVNWFGIAHGIHVVDVDKSKRLKGIAQVLREGRTTFDDYSALCVTSSFDGSQPLMSCDVKRVLRRGDQWRVDIVLTSDPQLILPSDRELGLRIWHASLNQLRFAPVAVCDGRVVRRYRRKGEVATDQRTVQITPLKDEAQIDSFITAFVIPERSCRPIFQPNAFDNVYEFAQGVENTPEGLTRVDVLPTHKNSVDAAETAWLDPKFGNAARRIVQHLGAPAGAISNAVPTQTSEITFDEFKQSPKGFWYPTVITRDPSLKSKRITRFYVDFADVPPEQLFRAD